MPRDNKSMRLSLLFLNGTLFDGKKKNQHACIGVNWEDWYGFLDVINPYVWATVRSHGWTQHANARYPH